MGLLQYKNYFLDHGCKNLKKINKSNQEAFKKNNNNKDYNNNNKISKNNIFKLNNVVQKHFTSIKILL